MSTDVFDALPDLLLSARLRTVVDRLRATCPGRRSRVIFAQAFEQAIVDGPAFARAARSVARGKPAVDRPGVPPVETQEKLNRATCRPLRRAS